MPNIIICIKQVPDPQHLSKIKIDPETKTIRREGIPAVLNPNDRNAIEEALRIQEKLGWNTIAISMGPPQAEEALRQALAMGVNEAILLCDKRFAGADTLATAITLAKAVTKIGDYKLILCGQETVDGSTGQVPPQIAEFLDLPHATRVKKIQLNTNEVLVESQIEYGTLKISMQLPAVISVTREINTPRIPPIKGILRACRQTITYWTLKDLNLDEEEVGLKGSPTQVTQVFTPKIERMGIIIKGSPEKAAKKLVEQLHKLGLI